MYRILLLLMYAVIVGSQDIDPGRAAGFRKITQTVFFNVNVTDGMKKLSIKSETNGFKLYIFGDYEKQPVCNIEATSSEWSSIGKSPHIDLKNPKPGTYHFCAFPYQEDYLVASPSYDLWYEADLPNKWSHAYHTMLLARSFHSTVTWRQGALFYGGEPSSSLTLYPYNTKLGKSPYITFQRSTDSETPPPVYHHVAVMYRDKYLYVFGGTPDSQRTISNMTQDELWRGKIDKYKPKEEQGFVLWNKLELQGPKKGDPVPSARVDHAAYLNFDEMIMYGGFDKDGVPLNDLWSFSIESETWKLLKTKKGPLYPLLYPKMVRGYYSIYIFGQNSTTDQMEVWEFNGGINRYRKIDFKGDIPPNGIRYQAITKCGRRVIMFGGQNYTSSFNGTTNITNMVWEYNLNEHKWTILTENDLGTKLPPPTMGASGASRDNYLYFWGGVTESGIGTQMIQSDLWLLRQKKSCTGLPYFLIVSVCIEGVFLLSMCVLICICKQRSSRPFCR